MSLNTDQWDIGDLKEFYSYSSIGPDSQGVTFIIFKPWKREFETWQI